MIGSFRDDETRKVWEGTVSRKLPIQIQAVARRKLRMLNAAKRIEDLRSPPRNRLEKLQGVNPCRWFGNRSPPAAPLELLPRPTGAGCVSRHMLDGFLYLGDAADAELDGLVSADADGDDADQSPDDEDGVSFTAALVPGMSVSLDVQASAAGALSAWLDTNQDGHWEAGEQILTGQPVVAGPQTLFFTLAGDAAEGQTYARFRLCAPDGPCDAPTGPAESGEVEDYAVTIDADPDDDDDGVLDVDDECPDTPAGVTVSEKGCPCDEVTLDAR
jgi:hypothetical protein